MYIVGGIKGKRLIQADSWHETKALKLTPEKCRGLIISLAKTLLTVCSPLLGLVVCTQVLVQYQSLCRYIAQSRSSRLVSVLGRPLVAF